MHQARSWRPARPSASVLAVYAGCTLGLVTIVVCATNAVTAAQGVVLSLTSGLTLGAGTLGRFLGEFLPDLRAAWLRGFQQGFEAGMRTTSSQTRNPEPAQAKLHLLAAVPAELSAQPGTESAAPGPGQAGREASPVGQSDGSGPASVRHS